MASEVPQKEPDPQMNPQSPLRAESVVEIDTECRQGPPIRIAVKVVDAATDEVVRYASAEFHLEGKDLDGKPRHIKFACECFEPDEIQIDYENAAVSGIDNVPENWPFDVKAAISDLAHYRDTNATIVRLPFDADKHPKFRDQFIAFLNRTPRPRLWQCHGIGGIDRGDISWDRLMSLYQASLLEEANLKKTGLLGTTMDVNANNRLQVKPSIIPVPAQHHFSSPEEARIKLGYGRFIEHIWETMVADDLSRGEFKAAFVQVTSKDVLACVKRNFDGQSLHKAVLDDHMTMSLTFNEGGFKGFDGERTGFRAVNVSGGITSNHIGIDCDFVVSISKRPPREVYWKATRIGQTANFIDIDFKIEVIDKLAKDSLGAIRKFYGENWPYHKRFWSCLLGAPTIPEHFMRDLMALDQARIDRTIQQVIDKMIGNGTPPNAEQERIIRGCGCSLSGFKLIWGPPGTGKTFLATKLAEVFLRCEDTGVAIFAPSNGSTDRIFDALQDWLSTGRGIPDDRFKPIRAHRYFLELEYFWKIVDPFGQANYTNGANARFLTSATGQYYARQKEAAQKKLMQNPEVGVTAAVLRAVETGQLFAKSQRSPKQRLDLLKAQEQIQTLRMFLERARKPCGCGLTREERDSAFRAWNEIRIQIIGTKRLLVSTVGNASSKLLQNSAMRDVKHIVLILDEQALDTDSNLINTLVNFITMERVENEFNGITPIVNVILIGDHKQNAPLIKSNEANANIFGPQMALSLFKRLCQTGFKVDALLEQHRMAPALCKLPSRRCYDDKLRTSPRTAARRLTLSQRDFIMKYFGIDSTKIDLISRSASADKRLFIEDQFLRHLLLNVPAGQAQIEKSTQSRFNAANIDVAIRFVKAMISSKFMPAKNIRILTFYNAQRRRYINATLDLARELRLINGELDDMVHTADSFQGCEAKCVVLDLVTTHYGGPDTMGQ